ncbi:uncharacterized protein BXZ73DRAFT_47180 [Epithele typhae]|uniref:uncharacterized protein n=1 Tax=Epithele typhae TaxID=378194 RepID=UPI0020086A36|nr:uncharacterized protein BXZ73DRAFT_47180 [Epithele typhae]KAH9931614.1 hypothetical protein BXZ73DRAFT_47180 [Epithele typhae]
MTVDEHGVKKKKDRTNESFIVVRPPPSKTNHPLNLQVQLVPPSSRDFSRSSTGGRSREASVVPDEDPAPDMQLTRTSSNRSDVSMYSSYSQASFSSVASTSTTSSGRRMIIPLYNLQAHSVLTNVILDAGTDAKVAKFQRRGLEILGLATLEPIEVWGEGGNPTVLPGFSPNAASNALPDEHASRPSADFSQGVQTPASSRLSFTSDDHHHIAPPATPALPVTPATPSTPKHTPGSRKFFGKLFKRRGDSPTNSPGLPPSPLPPITAQPPSPIQSATPLPSTDQRPNRRSSLMLGGGASLGVSGHSSVPSGSEGAPPVGDGSTYLLPPVLGLQPTLSSQTYPPRGRSTKYVWVVRKWLKGTPDSILSGMKDKFARTGPNPGTVEGMVEVRFEWSRGKHRRGHRENTLEEGSRSKRHSYAASSAAQSTTSLHQSPPQVVISDPPSTRRKKRASIHESHPTRASMDSRRSGSPGTGAGGSDEDRAKASPPTTLENDGDESDPEDSETPWTCTLIVRRLGGSRLAPAPAGAGTNSAGNVKVKIAGVVPTPHHPKVVALLKVPFPLPDIEIERVSVRKRVITPAGVARPATVNDERPGSLTGKQVGSGMKFFGSTKENGAMGPPEGLVLTAEEIKDVVSCTAMWLVVREGFGGVGRANRKGDGGWRMR